MNDQLLPGSEPPDNEPPTRPLALGYEAPLDRLHRGKRPRGIDAVVPIVAGICLGAIAGMLAIGFSLPLIHLVFQENFWLAAIFVYLAAWAGLLYLSWNHYRDAVNWDVKAIWTLWFRLSVAFALFGMAILCFAWRKSPW